MANKFIVFVVLAAVAQASLASSTKGSSIVEIARERARITWRSLGETICKAVRNNSWPVEDAEEEFRLKLVVTGDIFLEVAPNGDSQELRNESTAAAKILREGLFGSLEKARTCKSYATTIAEIEETRNQLPYNRLAEALQNLAGNTDPTASAENQYMNYYRSMFAEVEKLAKVTCGGQRCLGDCDLEGIHSAIDVVVDIVFGWIEE